MNIKKFAHASHTSVAFSDSMAVTENPLGDPASTRSATPDNRAWANVPLFAEMIVDLFSRSGLPLEVVEQILALSSRVLHGQDVDQLKRLVDDFWDEVPEMIDAVVDLFATHPESTLIIADCSIDCAKRLLRGEGRLNSRAIVVNRSTSRGPGPVNRLGVRS